MPLKAVKPARPALAPLVRYWRRELLLNDWTFAVRYGKPEMDGVEMAGKVRPVRHLRTARIEIHDPDLLEEEQWEDFDVETTLVHEMMHVMVDVFFDNETRGDTCHVEWMIESASNALVKFKRRAEASNGKAKSDRKPGEVGASKNPPRA